MKSNEGTNTENCLVEKILELEVEAVDSLFRLIGCIPRPLDPQLFQSVELLQCDKKQRSLQQSNIARKP